ncbi:MAG: hypothetical protein KC457_20630 [Myxococcales bacterium]|nr:hypothetical protein [Myxococcales bacterium]
MPRLILGAKTKVRPKPGGERVRRFCPECKSDATFVEAKIERTVTAYVFVDLFSVDEKGYICSNCHEVMDLEDTSAPQDVNPEPEREGGVLGRIHAWQEERAREQAERARAHEAEEARERAEQAREAAREARRAEKAAKQKAVDDELAALKKKLGK